MNFKTKATKIVHFYLFLFFENFKICLLKIYQQLSQLILKARKSISKVNNLKFTCPSRKFNRMKL